MGRAKERNNRHFCRCGKVQRARIVSDHHPRLRGEGDQLDKARLADKRQHRGSLAVPEDLCCQCSIALPAAD
jgi:hypothetical protein